MEHQNTKMRAMLGAAAAVVAIAFGATGAMAYPMYDDTGSTNDCVSCHMDFQSVGSLHTSHQIYFGIQAGGPVSISCNVCHSNGGGTTPVYTFGSDLSGGGGGLGCAGCHGQSYGEVAATAPYVGEPKASGYGLRQVHVNAGVMVCHTCHSATPPGPVLDETSAPPYYSMGVTSLGNPCFSGQEDIPYDGDSVGLDNDGNGFADYPNDPNCGIPTTTSTTTSTTTTTLPVQCGPAPAVGCVAAEKAKLQINEKTAGKEKLKFQLTKLTSNVVQADFGNPVSGSTSYALCVYDAANVLVASYEVARAGQTCVGDPCWENFKDIGWQYADKDQFADGISKIQLAGGVAGTGKIKMQGKNDSSLLPTGIAAVLSGDTSATAQLLTQDGDCFGMALPTVKKNDGLVFQAQAP